MPHHAPNVFENEWEVEGTYEGRSGVIAQLGEVLNMGPVLFVTTTHEQVQAAVRKHVECWFSRRRCELEN